MKFKDIGWLIGICVSCIIVFIDSPILTAISLAVGLAWTGADIGETFD